MEILVDGKKRRRGRHVGERRGSDSVFEMVVAGFIAGAVIVDVMAVAGLALGLIGMPGTGMWGWMGVVTLWVCGIVWTASVIWSCRR